VECLAFSPDDRVLASGGDDNTVRLWDPATQSALSEPLVGHINRVTQVVFSPGSNMLASSSLGKTSNENAIILWDMKTRRMLGPPLVGQEGVAALAFSADGQMLASANEDGTISLFDVALRPPRPLGPPIAAHSPGANVVAFSPSSLWLASAGGDIISGRAPGETPIPQDGEIVLWDVSIESWINRACKRANRDLSPEEWMQFIGDEPHRRTCPE
jgi:WD40 repeat protein